MGTLSNTAHSAALVPGTPSSGPKGLEKRKLGTAAKIRERKRKRAAARKKNQGSDAKSIVKAATTATGGCESSGAGLEKAAGTTVKKQKKAAGAKARKSVGGLLSEALQAAMAEVDTESMGTAPAVSSVAPCDSRSGAEVPASAAREHVASSTADCSRGIVPRDRSDMGSNSRATDQTVAQILTELASRDLDGGVHHPEVKKVADRTGKASRRAHTAATDQCVTARTHVPLATELDAATECGDTVIELGTSDTDESSDGDVYYPIYGKYYSSKQVTVTDAYATTTKTWRVARINDRRNSPRGPEYRVLWLSRLLVNQRYYQRTWEPLQQLLDDGFADEVDLVDRWKESGDEKFKAFWPRDEFGKRAIGADARDLCMFTALKRATELAGRPDIITQDDIGMFVADELREHGVDLARGTSWKVVLRFLRRLRDAGRDFIFKAIDKDNFAVVGGARVLEEVHLYNGLYFFVAYNHSLVGHAFVLSVQGNKGKVRRIYDLKESKPVSSASDWITFVACIRVSLSLRKSSS
ncbi:unnamed protein product [Phytophthora fragariaefolia]|uniref:Unnamed protein product n=1 Tax=Phytophthora fragariaefolia TaxID=1490495 RepID=A0A9W6Y0N6_9STRA|nr:unnamed protein product [Phytophthora fragariaefolia]